MRYYLFLFLLHFGSIMFSQPANVMISSSNMPQEPSIVINPKNPNQLVGGANLNNYFYSSNGGATWNYGTLHSTWGVWGDPVLIVDTSGNFYFFHLSDYPLGEWIDRIVCQKSTDGGVSWSDGTWFGLYGTKAQDKQWATVDRRTNIIYVTWTQFDEYESTNPLDSSIILFTKSVDGAETWSEPKRINKIAGDCLDSDNTVEGAVPAVGTDGEIYVVWMGPAGLVFDKSTDQGVTWLDNDIIVTNVPGGWDIDIPGINRCNGLPVICCDTSQGTYRGTIYINWSDQRNGTDDTDVWLVKSSDCGNTWSLPVRVNNDLPGRNQFFSWMAIDQSNGKLYFVFYDRRNYSDRQTDVYMAVSEDAGNTFTNFRISESPFIPNTTVFFGDYINITAYNNIIRPVWARMNGASLSLWTALLNINPDSGIDLEQISGYMLCQNQPNPFNTETAISFKIPEPVRVILRVSDMYGKEIAVIFDDSPVETGKHTISFNALNYNLSPGIYYISMIAQDAVMMRKMVIQ